MYSSSFSTNDSNAFATSTLNLKKNTEQSMQINLILQTNFNNVWILMAQ